MSQLRITLACGDYDRVAALKDGRLRPEGTELNFIPLGPEEIFFRMARYQEFDVSEMSLASYITASVQGQEDFIAIPIFPSRMFRHAAIFVNSGAGIQKPEDLEGRRVGVAEYQMTAIVWMKGILSDDFGLKPSHIHWHTGGQEQPGREERVPLQLPAEIQVTRIPPDQTLSEMLAKGELDALIAARMPSPFRNGSPTVRRLFQNPREHEEGYFKRTGIFPIMHTVVIRRPLYDANPWLAVSLYKAFDRAQQLSQEAIFGAPALPYQLAWLQLYLEKERSLLGSASWDNGAEPNRKAVETLCRYLVEQGIISKAPPLETLFATNTLTLATI